MRILFFLWYVSIWYSGFHDCLFDFTLDSPSDWHCRDRPFDPDCSRPCTLEECSPGTHQCVNDTIMSHGLIRLNCLATIGVGCHKTCPAGASHPGLPLVPGKVIIYLKSFLPFYVYGLVLSFTYLYI